MKGSIYYPILLTTQHNKEDTLQQRELMWSSYDRLSDTDKELYSSSEMADAIMRVQQDYKLSDDQVEEISRAIRLYFFGGKVDAYFVSHITAQVGVSESDAMTILERTVKNITLHSKQEPQRVPKTETLPLKQIAERYPQALTEMIGADPIVVDRASQPLRPTAQNWIATYTRVEGVMQHDDLTRGNFVYRSQITRGLTTADRSKVIALLTAYDRGTPLPIDVERQELQWSDIPADSPERGIPTTPEQSARLKRSAQEKHASRNSRITPIAQRGEKPVSSGHIQRGAAGTAPAEGPRARNARIQAQKDGMPVESSSVKKREPLGSSHAAASAHVEGRNTPKHNPPSAQSPQAEAENRSMQQFELKGPETPEHMHRTIREQGWQSQEQSSSTQRMSKGESPAMTPQSGTSAGASTAQDSGDVSFTSGQKLPTENPKSRKTAETRKHSPFHIAPVGKS